MIKAEKELYLPTRHYFEKQGFSVDGEVKNCDLVAIKNDIVVVAELKKTFNISLVYQLMEEKILLHMYMLLFLDLRISETKRLSKCLNWLNY